MNVLFFNSFTFLSREVLHALERFPGIRLIKVSIPEKVPPEAVDEVFAQFKDHLPAIVLSLNDAGYDTEGRMSRLIAATGSYQVNWHHDDPLYEEILLGRRPPCLDRRIDFVTEASFVSAMTARGRKAFFLPLAVDPFYFNTNIEVSLERDAAFVGNTSLEFIDTLIDEATGKELERFGSLIADLRAQYDANPGVDLAGYLFDHTQLWRDKTSLQPERFVFTVIWLVGYMHRRDFVVGLARHLGPRFMCFGDGYWTRFIDASLVSADACYYTTLCRYYRSTRVNININRIQIRTSFTQRIFDCLASGAFILTDRREMNRRFFKIEGPDRELVEFESLQHCLSLIEYFVHHDDERQAIASAGRARVLDEHTYDHRIKYLFDTVRSQYGI